MNENDEWTAKIGHSLFKLAQAQWPMMHMKTNGVNRHIFQSFFSFGSLLLKHYDNSLKHLRLALLSSVANKINIEILITQNSLRSVLARIEC